MQNDPSATMRLIEMAERLTPSGEIGDGLVAQFHEAATLARLELTPCKGSWSKCPNARQALQAGGPMAGAPIMRCARTGQHPDDCVR